jgi:hypothetical protein
MDLERATGRVFQLSVGLMAAGAIGYFLARGWRGGSGFLLGSAIAYLNFRWMRRLVDALGDSAPKKKPKSWMAVLLGLRYLLLGLIAYAILRFSEISLTATLAGLFVPAAAVILEILIELIFART